MRVSVSKVDNWLYYMRSEHKTLAEFRDELMGRAVQTDAMRMGGTFHKLFEEASPGFAADEVTVDGYTFKFDGDIEVPIGGLAEVPGSATYDIDGLPVEVRARTDRLLGNEVRDYKMISKWDEATYVRFQDSFQWRAYLDIFDAERFLYQLFFKKVDREGIVHITDTMNIGFNRYPGMRGDIERTLRDFLTFTKKHVPEWYREAVNG